MAKSSPDKDFDGASYELDAHIDALWSAYEIDGKRPSIEEIMLKDALAEDEFKRLKEGGPISLLVVCEDGAAAGAMIRILTRITRQTAVRNRIFYMSGSTLSATGHRTIASCLEDGNGAIAVVTKDDEAPVTMKIVAERTVVIPHPTRETVEKAIKVRYRGLPSKALAAIDLAALPFDLIQVAVTSAKDAKECVARLKRASDLGTPKPADIDPDIPVLEDAIEYGAARLWGLELKCDIADFKAGKIDWRSIDHGAVLFGIPGTGKSLFAQSLANACGIPLIKGSMGDFFATSKGDLGDVLKRQREIFQSARKVAPCILFLDEINALPSIDAMEGRSRDWWRPIILDFYTQLDSLSSDREGIVAIGATNRIEDIDTALLRPGRLERAIRIDPPDAAGVERILRHHLRGQLKDENLGELAMLAAGMTPAVIMDRVRSAGRLARRRNRPIELEDLRATILGSREIVEKDMYRIAVHEAGHALAVTLAESLLLADVSIIGTDNNCGHVTFHRRSSIMTLQSFEEEIIVWLGGRAAEIIFLGEPSAGAGGEATSDLAQATSLLTSMSISMGLDTNGRLLWRAPPMHGSVLLNSDARLRIEVEMQLRKLQTRAEALVRTNQEVVHQIAHALMKDIRLSGSQVHKLMGDDSQAT